MKNTMNFLLNKLFVILQCFEYNLKLKKMIIKKSVIFCKIRSFFYSAVNFDFMVTLIVYGK